MCKGFTENSGYSEDSASVGLRQGLRFHNWNKIPSSSVTVSYLRSKDLKQTDHPSNFNDDFVSLLTVTRSRKDLVAIKAFYSLEIHILT